ncbi:MAG: amidohydrolase [Burkholderiales bacterium]
MPFPRSLLPFVVSLAVAAPALAAETLPDRLDREVKALESRIVSWRRDIHSHPELSNRETRTGTLVAAHLRSLGLDVQTGVAHTGVVALLKGGKPGPVVALRADMDALPVTEDVDVPFRSTVTAEYAGQKVGVMHACGHDGHTAVLMAVAQALVAVKDELPGTVKFIFQPAEEGAPAGEKGGALLMLEQGVFENPKPDAIFGLHVVSGTPTGTITYRSGPFMASNDWLTIKVKGRQTHGAWPWNGVDPVVTSAQILTGLQNIVSRQIDVSKEPAVVTVATVHGGVRRNIIPDGVEMAGTIRTFDEAMRRDIHARIKHIAEAIASANDAQAEVTIETSTTVTNNDPALTERTLPSLKRIVGNDSVKVSQRVMVAEDFSYFQEKVPGVFFFVGVTPKDQDASKAAPNHSPRFYIDEPALLTAARSLAAVTVDFLSAGKR